MPSLLEQLLAPFGVDAFVEQWGRRVVHIPGDSEKLVDLYSLQRFKESLGTPWPEDIHLRAVGSDGDRAGGDITRGQVLEAFEAGATICVSRLDRVEPDLDRLCRSVGVALGCLGGVHVNAYWSPDGKGFAEHFDLRIATTLQLSGAKRWRYSTQPVTPWPLGNGRIQDARIQWLGRPLVDIEPPHPEVIAPDAEIVLQQGDVLCLPAGCLHAAEALGESFALNLHFNPTLLGDLVGDILDDLLFDDPRWRYLPPLSTGPRDGMRDEGLEAVTERLSLASAALGELCDDRERLAHALASRIARRRPAPSTSGDLLRVSPGVVVVHASPHLVELYIGEAHAELVDEIAAYFHRALEAGSFEPGHLEVSGLHATDAKEAEEALLHVGILETF